MVTLPEGLLGRLDAEHPHPRAFVTISGAHLYGFASRDSDVDVRGAHLLPVEQVVGLDVGRETFTWMGDHDGVETDIVTHDLGKFCKLLLKGSGDVLEQLVSPLVLASSPVHEELLALVPQVVTSNHAHHYGGFGRGRWRAFEAGKRLKPLLYTFRSYLTGIHLMRTGEVRPGLPELAAEYGPSYLAGLIEAKAAAEQGGLPADAPGHEVLSGDVEALSARLEEERAASSLPPRPAAYPALNDLVVRTRLGK
ncbi:nucleotidyltransferase domain-containing protein [Actinomadura macrotermitis]|uniref:Nucleotidyltransferase n=1 Tax=Actinomadura macrotermitis TaxID=2585200 RepID=A0A7K0C4I8_9ACTN|nr:nucleotidyltransferase domain-containing protein [Actinomadura macrotermitis]MQY08032.1 hypothetical protein [Actinomadura macrotermitis]